MTPLGWLFLAVPLVFVWGLAAWCYYRVLTLPPVHEEEAIRGDWEDSLGE